ncbi:hypothetical protein RIF29_14612 [Crotalaria pallida]|uniref:Uncharacterized protein n=1 Tax=Crotalaria pallida TaxID=3830 RepID=A0AAN9FFP0_CROPI
MDSAHTLSNGFFFGFCSSPYLLLLLLLRYAAVAVEVGNQMVRGFETIMAKWMGACDCIITKVRTIAEALIRGLPIILNDYIPRQEKGNVPYVVENGASVFTRSSNETARIVAEWFSTKSDDLKRMSENALKLAQPEAVFDNLRDINELALVDLVQVDQLVEAVKILKGMGGAGCIPYFYSYGIVIGALCKVRKTVEEEDMMKQMVVKHGPTPGQGTLVKLFVTLRVNREIWKAVELIEFLDKEGYSVGFESYKLVVEGCVEKREHVLPGKVAVRMLVHFFVDSNIL